MNPRFPGRMPPGCWVPCRPTCRYVLRVGAGLATAQTAVTSAGADCGLRAWVLKNPGSDPVVQPGTWRSRGRKPASPGGCRRAVGLQAVPQNDLPSCAACRGGPRGRPDRGNVCRRRSALRETDTCVFFYGLGGGEPRPYSVAPSTCETAPAVVPAAQPIPSPMPPHAPALGMNMAMKPPPIQTCCTTGL